MCYWRVGRSGFIELALSLAGYLLLVSDLLSEPLGLCESINCLLIIKDVALGATKHVKNALFDVPLSAFIGIGSLDQPLALLIQGSVLFLHYQVKQLVLETVKSDDEIDQGDFRGDFW